MVVRRLALLVAAAALASACSSDTSSIGPVDDTIEIGGLPLSASTTAPVDTTPIVTTAAAPGTQAGSRVTGNRVILIGDSVLASTSSRYGGEMCKALVPLGWQAEVDAETGQFVPWGNLVLDDRLSAGWDVAVILLGNNYLGDEGKYRFELERMVNRLSPAVVVLVRVAEISDSRKEINAVIDSLAVTYPNVMTLDWAAVAKANRKLAGADRLHLTTAGRVQLAAEVANVLGQAPTTPGKCLPTDYTDDSRSPVTGTTVKGATTTTEGSDTTVPETDPPVEPTPTPTPDPTPSPTP